MCINSDSLMKHVLSTVLRLSIRVEQAGGRVQVVQGLQGEVMLGGAACLAGQGFLDTAQDLLSQHRAAVGKGHMPSLQAQLRLRIAQVSPHLPAP